MKQLFSVSIIFFIFTGICRAQDSLHVITPNTSAEKNKFYMPRENSKEYFLEKGSKLNTTAWVSAWLRYSNGCNRNHIV